MTRRCIYHVPYPITNDAKAASAIRPRKMMEAFQKKFDEVFVISGYGKERKQKFKELKKQVTSGVKYDFMYSENSTMPNLLTEKDHIPRYPFLEKEIFRFCKKNFIPIGLFYRDIYWKFSVYKQSVSFLKRCITIPMYKYDLKIYNKYVDILYLPSEIMNQYVAFKGKVKPLPPGTDNICENRIKNDKLIKKIELFYVGGVGGDYDVTELIEGMRECSVAHLTLCCHADQWEKWFNLKKIELPDNVTIIHKSGSELEEYYKNADIGMLFFESDGYRKMAMPVKLFEYMGHQLPVIATVNCVAGEFVEKNKIGWTISYNRTSLVQLLQHLYHNKNILENVSLNISKVIVNNTWDARVMSIYEDLENMKGKL